jgi:DNA-binding XRE family transcriptional regulator
MTIIKRLITGNDLKRMQKKAGLTNNQMAKVAGLASRKAYEKWCADKGEPSISQFILISIACQLNSKILISLITSRRHLTDELDLAVAEKK